MAAVSENKQLNDVKWYHKIQCLYHDIYCIAKKYFNQELIPESHWKICQCGKFNKEIKDDKWLYKIGLNEITSGSGINNKAHYSDLKLCINDKIWETQLLAMQAGEIKKSLQPSTRETLIATGAFHDMNFIQKYDGPYYVQWKLKEKYIKEEVKVDIKKKRKDVAPFWYQNWGINGIRETGEPNFETKPFVGIHNNRFIGGTSREKCEQRIVLYIYAGKNAPKIESININGIELTSRKEYEQIKKNKQKRKKKKKAKANIKPMGGSIHSPIKVGNDYNKNIQFRSDLHENHILNNFNQTPYMNIHQHQIIQLEQMVEKEQKEKQKIINQAISLIELIENQKKETQDIYMQLLQSQQENKGLRDLIQNLLFSTTNTSQIYNAYNSTSNINFNDEINLNRPGTPCNNINLHNTSIYNINKQHNTTMDTTSIGNNDNILGNFINEINISKINEPPKKKRKLNNEQKNTNNMHNKVKISKNDGNHAFGIIKEVSNINNIANINKMPNTKYTSHVADSLSTSLHSPININNIKKENINNYQLNEHQMNTDLVQITNNDISPSFPLISIDLNNLYPSIPSNILPTMQ